MKAHPASTPEVIQLGPAQMGLGPEPLDAAWFDRPQIEAALEGRRPVRVFVDRLPEPRSVLLCDPYDYYVAGDPEAGGLRRFIADAPAEAGAFGEVYGFCPVGEPWKQAMLHDYGERLERIGRRQFHYTATSAPRYDPPAGYRLVRIDAGLAQRVDQELNEHIGAVWGGYEPFAAAGLGCCLLAGEAIASAAYPAAVSSRWADANVATAEAFRRRGLARAVCCAYVGECVRRGLKVAWDTDEPNVASAELAQRLGFVEQQAFSELASPGRRPLALSPGLWAWDAAPRPDWPGARRWQRFT